MGEATFLPEKVYPDVQIDSGLEYSTPKGVMYGNGHETCQRIFRIADYCEYIEYFESYSGKSFQLYNAELSIFTFKDVFMNQILASYPDMVDPRKVPDINKIPDFKRVVREDLFKPLVRRDIKEYEDTGNCCSSNSTPSGMWRELEIALGKMNKDVSSNRKEIDRLFNIINDLSQKVSRLEEDNAVLKKQVKDLSEGQVPEELSSGILENMFEE